MIVACWRVEKSVAIGSLHLRYDAARRWVTRCTSRPSVIAPAWSWSCDPEQWPDLPACRLCARDLGFLRDGLKREGERLSEFERRVAR